MMFVHSLGGRRSLLSPRTRALPSHRELHQSFFLSVQHHRLPSLSPSSSSIASLPKWTLPTGFPSSSSRCCATTKDINKKVPIPKQRTPKIYMKRSDLSPRPNDPRLRLPPLPSELALQADKWRQLADLNDPEGCFHVGLLHLAGRGGSDLDETKGVEMVMKAAQGGWPNAMFLLARLYAKQTGTGSLTQNFSQAFEWCLKAAKEGLPVAMFETSRLYVQGQGVQKDSKESVMWLKKAVEADYMGAVWQLATLYMEGDMVEKDEEKAIELFEKGAEKKHVECIRSLATAYLLGKGVEKDVKKGLQILEEAATYAPAACMHLAEVYSMGTEDLKPDEAKVLKYTKMAAEKGYTDGMFAYGSLLRATDKKAAFPWLEKAVARMHPTAMSDLGMLYKEGILGFLEPDLVKSVELWKKGSELGSPDAQFNLSIHYGERKEEKKSLELLEQAVKSNHPVALTTLAVKYATGQGVPINDKKSEDLFTKAAQQGLGEAEVNLGILLMRRIPPQKEKALFWLRRAMEKDTPRAKEVYNAVVAHSTPQETQQKNPQEKN